MGFEGPEAFKGCVEGFQEDSGRGRFVPAPVFSQRQELLGGRHLRRRLRRSPLR